MQEILRVGTSAGGARPKALIAWNPETEEVRSGQIEVPPGFEYWILKFDGVDDTSRDLGRSRGYGAIEWAYSEMARAAGIEMTECRLLEEGDRRHFMTRRFDRAADGDKLHMQSLGGARPPRLRARRSALLRAVLRRDPPPRPLRRGGRRAVPAHGLQRRRPQPGRPRQEHLLPDGPPRQLVPLPRLRRRLLLQPRRPLDASPPDVDQRQARQLHHRRPRPGGVGRRASNEAPPAGSPTRSPPPSPAGPSSPPPPKSPKRRSTPSTKPSASTSPASRRRASTDRRRFDRHGDEDPGRPRWSRGQSPSTWSCPRALSNRSSTFVELRRRPCRSVL